jgi:ribosomal protein L7/L12
MFDLFDGGAQSKTLIRRLNAIERKLDLVMKHLGITDHGPGTTLPQDVAALADQGQTISAIKAYRERTGAGLAEAKDLIETYIRSRK